MENLTNRDAVKFIKSQVDQLKERNYTEFQIESFFIENYEEFHKRYTHLIKMIIKNDDLTTLYKMLNILDIEDESEKQKQSLIMAEELRVEYNVPRPEDLGKDDKKDN